MSSSNGIHTQTSANAPQSAYAPPSGQARAAALASEPPPAASTLTRSSASSAPLPSFKMVFHVTAYVVLSLIILLPAFGLIGLALAPFVIGILRGIFM